MVVQTIANSFAPEEPLRDVLNALPVRRVLGKTALVTRQLVNCAKNAEVTAESKAAL